MSPTRSWCHLYFGVMSGARSAFRDRRGVAVGLTYFAGGGAPSSSKMLMGFRPIAFNFSHSHCTLPRVRQFLAAWSLL